jgi:putative transposase
MDNLTLQQIRELIIALCLKGLNMKDIFDVLKIIWSKQIIDTYINNIIEEFGNLRLSWLQSKLEPYYKVVYASTVPINVKRDNVQCKEFLHIIYGIRDDNKRELLNLSIHHNESALNWSYELKILKKRGIFYVHLFIAHDLPNIEHEIKKYFPQADFQKCITYIKRQLLRQVTKKYKSELSKDLKHLFDNFAQESCIEDANKKTQQFILKWQDSFGDIEHLNKNIEYYFTYIKFPYQIRKMICSTDSMASIRKKIDHLAKEKPKFEAVENLLDYIFIMIKDLEIESWLKYPVPNFTYWH